MSRKTFSSGQYETYAYDSRSRVTQIVVRNSGGTALRTTVYTYDASSKILTQTVNGVATTFGYDLAGQLVSENRSGYAASYTYDGNGNRLTRTVNGVTETYAYDDGDKLLSVSVGGSVAKSYGYDAAGRTTSITSSAGTTSLTYDFEGRAVTISGPGISQTNTYNGLDTRVGSTTNSVAQTFLRDGAYVTDPVLKDSLAVYTPGTSERRGGASRFLHSGLKSVEGQTNTSQVMAAARQYDAFGNVLSGSNWSGPFGYAGGFGYQEDATGLKLLGHRYYDSSTGRFLTRDPIKDGKNWYTYAWNDPVNGVDPDGLAKIWLAWHPVTGGAHHLLLIIKCESTGRIWVFDAGPRRDPRKTGTGRNLSTKLRGAGRLITDPSEYETIMDYDSILLLDDEKSAQHWIAHFYSAIPGEVPYDPIGLPGLRPHEIIWRDRTANSNSWLSELLGRGGFGRPEVPVSVPRYGHRPHQWRQEVREFPRESS